MNMHLNQNWKIQGFEVGERRPLELAAYDFDDRFWINSSMPSDVHSILLERQLIPNPYFGHQDQASRYIEHKEWWYRKTFQFKASDYPSTYSHELVFEGLDTFATIYLNGLELGKAANMHRRFIFNIKRWLKDGKNVIAIKFDPIQLHIENKQLFDWSSYTKERPWVRKAAMNWGWDWGPRLVTVGIWKDVLLESKPSLHFSSVFIDTVTTTEKLAVLDVRVRLSERIVLDSVQLNYTIFNKEGHSVSQGKYPLHRERDYSFTIELANPELWWTYDLGEPHLYRIVLQLEQQHTAIDHYEQALGIRTIELRQNNEEGQPSFQFVLNGVKLFAKGANWIPADHMIATIPEQRYVDLIALARFSNMNMLRVWAGGIYEKDCFYELCDQQGILVWQDFAFANTLFPDFNADFEVNVKKEIRDNVERLRTHACLAIWCGNNEIDWLYDMKSSEGTISSPFYGQDIYHKWIPELLEELDARRPYWPSSPFGGNDDNDPNIGDRHNWQVWHGSVYPRHRGEAPLLDYSVEGVSFRHYKQDTTLFSSEFGMHASANRYTLEHYIPKGQFYWNSDEMAYRNKDTNHLKGILLMEGYTGNPESIDQYMSYSMLTQAEGLKYGIEHYRRNMTRTSGSLIWQFNDSWPGTSWSLIDYLLLPKAAFYYAKRFYAPLLLSMEHEPNQPLHFFIINDSRHHYSGEVIIHIQTFNGESIVKLNVDVSVEPYQCKAIVTIEEQDLLEHVTADCLVVSLSSNQLPVCQNEYMLRDHRELALPTAKLSWTIDEFASTVTITAEGTVARMVTLELIGQPVSFADNFFTLLPNQTRTISIYSAPSSIDWSQLRVHAINQ